MGGPLHARLHDVCTITVLKEQAAETTNTMQNQSRSMKLCLHRFIQRLSDKDPQFDGLKPDDGTVDDDLVATISGLLSNIEANLDVALLDHYHSLLAKMNERLRRASVSNRGVFIVFEGGDRSGKSTQAAKLVTHLKENGIACEAARFPNRDSFSGRIINAYLTNETVLTNSAAVPWITHALFAYNRWEQMEEFAQMMEQGTHIICDRYSFSGVNYSNCAQNLPPELTSLLECGLLKPDLVIQPTIDETTVNARPGFGEERYESAELQKKVRMFFDRYHTWRWWRLVDGNDTISAIHEVVKKLVTDTMMECNNRPMGILTLEHCIGKK